MNNLLMEEFSFASMGKKIFAENLFHEILTDKLT